MKITCMGAMLVCATVGVAAFMNDQYVLAAVSAVLVALNVVTYRTLRKINRSTL